MLSRTTTTSLAGRASSMRRMRRRSGSTTIRPMCRTNGCATFLEVDPTTGVATCPICSYALRPH